MGPTFKKGYWDTDPNPHNVHRPAGTASAPGHWLVDSTCFAFKAERWMSSPQTAATRALAASSKPIIASWSRDALRS